MRVCSLNTLIEALNSNEPLNNVFISNSKRGTQIDIIKKLCKEKGVTFQIVPQKAIDRKAGSNNKGIFAEISPVRFYKLEEILKEQKNGLILILDSINDTGNLGAIIRTAVAACVDGILIPRRKSAPINETVLKTSAGSLTKAKIVLSKNLTNDIIALKKNGFWIIGTHVKEGLEYYKYDFKYKTALIIGNENKGISPLLKKNSDQLISIPHSSQVESLNVSNSVAILLFEALRQKIT
jgi:23S rRNA (guanosine2251-2'-O)-methyltransferase